MKKKLIFILIPLILIIGGAVSAYFYVNSKIHVETPIEKIFEDPEDQQQAQIDEEKGLTNILLVGVDAREGEKTGRTDSIILATIDANNKKVKLTSFMRDMYVPIPGHGNSRINAAYTMGGPELLIKTLNQDFGLNIQYFASINFKAFQSVVDKLGGVDLEVKDYEVDEINKYIWEVNGAAGTFLKSPGVQHLNGEQALSYSRIRHVGNGDYERTERQRKVLGLLVDKAKKTNLIKLPDLFSSILPYVKTNVPTTKIMSLGYTVYKFGSSPMEDLRIPADGMYSNVTIELGGVPAAILLPNLDKNVALLDNFIYSSGGSVASDIPPYIVNKYHSNDIALDTRGQKRTIPKIELPKPKVQPEKQVTPEENQQQEQQTGDNPSTGTGTSTGKTPSEGTGTGGNTGGTGNQTGGTPGGTSGGTSGGSTGGGNSGTSGGSNGGSSGTGSGNTTTP